MGVLNWISACFVPIFASLVIAGTVQAAPALAAGLKIAVVAPADGPFALLGQQILDGARFQAEDRGSEIIAIAETCEPKDAETLTKALLASGAEAAIGFLCTESLDGGACRHWPRLAFRR